MAPRLQILSNVIERLKNLKDNVTGHLYGVMYNNTLTVLTFSINRSNDGECTIDHTTLQLNMPAEVYLCGSLHVGQQEEDISETFQDVDITDNPLFLKYSHDESDIKSYFYIHQKLEIVNNVQIINESDISKEFVYIRLQGRISLMTQNGNVIEVLEESRKNIAFGKTGIHFPSKNKFLFNSDNNLKDISLKELLDVSQVPEGPKNLKKGVTHSAGVVNAVNANMLFKMSDYKPSEECVKCAPVLQYVRRPFDSLECNLIVDTLSLVNLNIHSSELYGILVESICRNIKLIEKCFSNQLPQAESMHSLKLPVPVHFKPQNCGHLLTLVYPNGYSDEQLKEYRESLHRVLALDMTRPFFRYGNAVRFYNDSQADNLIINPHESISQTEEPSNTRNVSIVQGLYTYHHYMQDNFDDNGWGCAYRSLQTIVSWYRLQGYTDVPIPSHSKIQKCLSNISDEPSKFVNSKQWIGSFEVSMVLEALLGVTVRILCASTGEEVSSLAPNLLYHFQTQGTPVMIGGGVLAHTILGVSYDEVTGDAKFLILDPHYTGPDHLPTIISKGWCGWKTKDFWKKDAFYNMCLPERPVCF